MSARDPTLPRVSPNHAPNLHFTRAVVTCAEALAHPRTRRFAVDANLFASSTLLVFGSRLGLGAGLVGSLELEVAFADPTDTTQHQAKRPS